MSSSSSSSKPTASGDLRQRRSGHGGETRKTVDHQNNGRTGPETPKHEPHKVDKDSDDFSVVQQYPESFVDDEPDRFWLIYWDACGIFCFLFGEAVVWFAHYVTITKVVIPMLFQANRWPFWTLILVNGICFQIAVIFLTIAHFRAMLTNPGTVKQNTAAASEINPDPELRERLAEQQTSEAMKTVYRELTMRYCERCRAIKPPRAHHCSVAQRCIIRMDHNCPWVNNTVGQNNYKYFVLFILYVFIGCSVSVFLTSLRGWWCWKIGPCSFYTTGEMVMMIVSAILALFFAIFVATMAYDQFEGLTTDTSGVEAMKMWLEKDIPVSKGLEHYMGCKFGLSWLLPIQPENPAIYRWTPKGRTEVLFSLIPFCQLTIYD